jgi:O-antigen/teichoic acid export membrane protein
VNLSGFAAYAAAGIFSAFPPLVLMPTLTGNLTPEDFGKTTLVWSALALLTALISFGAVNSASVRYFKLSRQEFANHLISIIALIGISAGILLVGGAFVNFHIYTFLPIKKVEFIIVLMISTLMAFGQLFGSLAVATVRPFSYLKIYTFYGVITVVLVNFFVLMLGMQITGFFLGVLFGAFGLAIAAFSGNSNRVTGGTVSIKDSKSALSFGLPIMFHSLALNLSSTSDRFIIASTVGLTQLALYSATAQVALLANFAAHAIIKGVQPRLYGLLRCPDNSTIKSVRRLAYFYMGTTFLLSLMIGLFTPLIIELIAGSVYRIDWNTTLFLIVGGLFGSWYLFFSLFIHFYERTLHISAITIMSAVLQIFLCYQLVSINGIAGAAIAYAASNCVMFVSTLFAARVNIKMHL